LFLYILLLFKMISPTITDHINKEINDVYNDFKQDNGGITANILLENTIIDILCFGRSGIGKSTLLSALTGKNINTSAQLDHCTTQLECYTYESKLSNDKILKFRYWDTKGIDDWQNIGNLFIDMEKYKINPITIIYCAHGMGRVDSKIVKSILDYFYKKEKTICYIITNKYALSDQQHKAQVIGGMQILREVTNTKKEIIYDSNRDYWPISDKVMLFCVNSTEYRSRGIVRSAEGINEILDFLSRELSTDDLKKLFLATHDNVPYWKDFLSKTSVKVNQLKDFIILNKDVIKNTTISIINIISFIMNIIK